MVAPESKNTGQQDLFGPSPGIDPAIPELIPQSDAFPAAPSIVQSGANENEVESCAEENALEPFQVQSLNLHEILGKIAAHDNFEPQTEYALYEALSRNLFAGSRNSLSEKTHLLEKLYYKVDTPSLKSELVRSVGEEQFDQFHNLVSSRYTMARLGNFLSKNHIVTEQRFARLVRSSGALYANPVDSPLEPSIVQSLEAFYSLQDLDKRTSAALVRSIVEERFGASSTVGSASLLFGQLLRASQTMGDRARQQLLNLYLEHGDSVGFHEFGSLLRLTGLSRTGNLEKLSITLRQDSSDEERDEFKGTIESLRCGPEIDFISLTGLSSEATKILSNLIDAHPGVIPAMQIEYREPSVQQLIELGMDEMKQRTEVARKEEELLVLYAAHQLNCSTSLDVIKATGMTPRSMDSALLRLQEKGLVDSIIDDRIILSQDLLDPETLNAARGVVEKYSKHARLGIADGVALTLRALGFENATVAITQPKNVAGSDVYWRLYY